MKSDNNTTMSNRDRFFERIKPLFESSRYEVCKATEGKYKDKIIQVINKGSGTHDFHIWCHTRNDRLDLVIPNFRINQIPDSIGLKEKNRNIKTGDRLDGQDATSFQEVDEDVLIEVVKYITTHVI